MNNPICVTWSIETFANFKGEDIPVDFQMANGKPTKDFTGKPVVSKRLFKYVLTPVAGWRIKSINGSI